MSPRALHRWIPEIVSEVDCHDPRRGQYEQRLWECFHRSLPDAIVARESRVTSVGVT